MSRTGSVRGRDSIMASDDMSCNVILRPTGEEVKRKECCSGNPTSRKRRETWGTHRYPPTGSHSENQGCLNCGLRVQTNPSMGRLYAEILPLACPACIRVCGFLCICHRR